MKVYDRCGYTRALLRGGAAVQTRIFIKMSLLSDWSTESGAMTTRNRAQTVRFSPSCDCKLCSVASHFLPLHNRYFVCSERKWYVRQLLLYARLFNECCLLLLTVA